jgi:hypothetical protein
MVGVYQFLASSASELITAGLIEADDGVSSSVSLNIINAVLQNP